MMRLLAGKRYEVIPITCDKDNLFVSGIYQNCGILGGSRQHFAQQRHVMPKFPE